MVPKETPVTVGLAAGICCPWAMKTLELTVPTAGLLLVRLIVTPPAGAGMPMLSARPELWPGATTRPWARVISEDVTVTVRVAGAKPGAEAVMVAVPAATPVTVNAPDVDP